MDFVCGCGHYGYRWWWREKTKKWDFKKNEKLGEKSKGRVFITRVIWSLVVSFFQNDLKLSLSFFAPKLMASQNRRRLLVDLKVGDIATVEGLKGLVSEEAFINSANTNLVSSNQVPPVTGIAKALWEAGGDTILHQCDRILQERSLSVGEAVRTDAGLLMEQTSLKMVIHAIAMGYRQKKEYVRKRRQLATPQTVAQALHAALRLADGQDGGPGVRSIAVQIMCSRPNYSIVAPSEAGRVMMNAMLIVLNSFEPTGSLERVVLYIQERLECAKLLVEAQSFLNFGCQQPIEQMSSEVWWVDKEFLGDQVSRNKEEVFALWRPKHITWKKFPSSQQLLDSLTQHQQPPKVIITNMRRPEGEEAGLKLIQTLRSEKFNYKGILIMYGFTVGKYITKVYETLQAGANLATADQDLVAEVVLTGCGQFEY